MQYFYIVVYTIVGDDLTMCKIGLNPHQLIEWGRREATKHPERSYKLYRQPITRTGKISFVKCLTPFADKKLEAAKFNLEEEVQRELDNGHQKLLKSGISFDDCFSPEQDFKLLTFYQLKI